MDWLKSVHFYRKVPRDLTEATLAGGTISLISSLIMAYLFITNFSSYLQLETTTTVQLDMAQDKKILINFNVTVLHLPCQYASVDIADIMGTHLQNVSANIQKYRVGSDGGRIGRVQMKPKQIVHADARAEDLESIPKVSPELTEDSLKEAVAAKRLLLVNFYAPWCPWSRRLQPVWEEAYLNLMKAGRGPDVMLAKADCTNPNAVNLCRHQHIHAFPTIRVYRHHSSVSHETYVGDRTHEALEKFVHENVDEADPAAAVEAGSSEVGQIGEGCMVRGVVLVNRVPGNFHISAHSKSHSFQPGKLNMSHEVTYMSFGRSLSSSMLRMLPSEVAAAYNVLSNSRHVAVGHNTTLEHYLKVVHTTYQLRGQKPIDTFQYTANNNNYQDGDALPAAVFSYDFSPMQVFVQERSKSFASFLTQICAIIGGVFTVTGLLDGMVYHGSQGLRRKLDLLGKSL